MATSSRQDPFMSKAYFGNILCPGHIRYFERSINPAQVTELVTNLAELLVARLRVTSYSATGLRPANILKFQIDFVYIPGKYDNSSTESESDSEILATIHAINAVSTPISLHIFFFH